MSARNPAKPDRIKSSAVRRRCAGGNGMDRPHRDRDRSGEYKPTSRGRRILPPHSIAHGIGGFAQSTQAAAPSSRRERMSSKLNLPSASS